MEFFINPAAFSAAFTVPSEVVDKHLKLATANQLKVLLFLFRNSSDGINEQKISEALSIPPSEVSDSLSFWSQRNILNSNTKTEEKTENPKPTVRAIKPTREDISRKGANDPKIQFLLREAQVKFGRHLKNNESITLVWLYEDNGIDISVLLLAIQYAISKNRCNITYIQKIALSWYDKGVETIADAEKIIAEDAQNELNWSIMQRITGLEKRNPSEKELSYVNKWLDEWKISYDLLKEAYNACIDAKMKFSFAYTDGILKRWKNDGITDFEKLMKAKEKAENTVENKDENKASDKEEKQKSNTKKETAKKSKNDYAAFDLDLFEKMLNSDD